MINILEIIWLSLTFFNLISCDPHKSNVISAELAQKTRPDPVVALVLDKGLDCEINQLKPFMDFEAMKKYNIYYNNQVMSLNEFNNNHNDNGIPTKIGKNLHGSLVALLLTKDLSPEKVKIISSPLFTPVYYHEKKFYYDFVDYNFNQIDSMIKEQNAKVVNFSLGYNIIKNPTNQNHEDLQNKSANYFMKKMEELIQNNHNVIFVAAMGNHGKNMDIDENSDMNLYTKIKQKNLIFVAAGELGSGLNNYSNYGSNTAHIAASGAVWYGSFNSVGTSYAAPRVANRILEIIIENPGFTSEETVNYLLTYETVMDESLKEKVKDNLFLSEKFPKT